MVLICKLLLISCLLVIFYQDLKDRAVWWFLFPALLVFAGYLHFLNAADGMWWINTLINSLVLMAILAISFLYVKFKMRLELFQEAFGLGDLLFFLGLCAAFPVVSFIIILVFSLLFSLILHVFLAKNSHQTVPLAGYASLFLVGIYLVNWTGVYPNLYHF